MSVIKKDSDDNKKPMGFFEKTLLVFRETTLIFGFDFIIHIQYSWKQKIFLFKLEIIFIESEPLLDYHYEVHEHAQEHVLRFIFDINYENFVKKAREKGNFVAKIHNRHKRRYFMYDFIVVQYHIGTPIQRGMD